ncbi:MAG: MFS transporter [SAR202 cluster bacterium]|nr:MFS transporter [SAR202 cluster bacterium]
MTMPRTFQAFTDRNYRLLWSANFIATSSRGLLLTLLGWYVLEETGSPWFVGLVGFCWIFPWFPLGLVGGVLADSSVRKGLLITTQTTGLASVTIIVVLLATGLGEFWHAHVLMLIIGSGDALDMPTRRSLAHDFLGNRGVTNAVALDSVGAGSSLMIGPAVAGALIAAFGMTSTGLAAATLFVSSLVVVSGLSIDKHIHSSQNKAGIVATLVDGVKYVAITPALLSMIIITVIMNLLLFPYMHIVPVIAKDILGVGPAHMGLLQAMSGLGTLIGSIFIASLKNVTHHGRIYLAGTVTCFIGLLLFSVSSTYTLSLLLVLTIGLGLAGFISMQSLIAMLVARQDMRGKALGVVSLAIGTGPFGALIVSAVAEQVGPSFALLLNAGVGLIMVIIVASIMPALRSRMLPDTEV